MKDKVLATITPQENKTYVDDLISLLSDAPLYLKSFDLDALCVKKPFVGQVLHGVFECERVLRLRKLEGIEYVPSHEDRPYKNGKIWLETEGINGNFSLSIGCNNGGVEIIRETCAKKEKYLFEDYGRHTGAWLRPPMTFLQSTLDLLEPEDQSQFRESIPALVKK